MQINSLLKPLILQSLFISFVILITPIISFAQQQRTILENKSLSTNTKSSVEALADLSIEQLMSIEVSSTTFFDIAPEKSPGSLYIVPQKLIESSYSASISDFLQYYVPGVHISNAYSSGSLYSTRGIASPSNATTLFMLNGTNMNVSSGTGINTNLNLPLLGDIQRIEVLKGPCSIIHGSGSINGFINVIPKNGRENLGGFIKSEVGLTDGLLKTETGYGSTSSEYGDIFIYAGGVKSDGIGESGNYKTAYNSLNSSDNAKIEEFSINNNYFPDINTRFSLNWNRENFTLFGVVQNEKIESTTPWRAFSIQPTAQDNNLQETSAGLYSQTSASNDNISSYSNKQVEMKTMALLPQLSLDLTDSENLTIGLPLQYFEYDPGAYLSPLQSEICSEIQLKSNLIFRTTRLPDHLIAFGGSAFSKQLSSDRISFYIPDLVDQNGDFMLDFKADLKWIETSIFFEDNYKLTKNLNLFAGIRYDKVRDSSFQITTLEGFSIINNDQIEVVPANYTNKSNDIYSIDVLIPRVGVTYDIDNNKTVKFVYQEGYHYPDYMTILKSIQLRDNKPIVAEEVQSYELSYYQDFMADRLQFNLSLYSNIFDNTIFSIISDELEQLTAHYRADEFASAGFEASFKFIPDSGTNMEVSYSFSQPYNMEDDTELNPYLVSKSGDHWRAFPEQTVKMNITRSFINDRLDISIGALFNSPTETVTQSTINSPINISSEESQESDLQTDALSKEQSVQELPSEYGSTTGDLFDHHRFVVNFGVRYHFTKNCSLTIKGENIFNNTVPAAGYYYSLQNYENISLEHPTYTIGLDWKF